MTALNTEWQPIETVPAGEWVVGAVEGWTPERVGPPYFVGQRYDMQDNALINWGNLCWVVCTHWSHLTPPNPSSERGRS